MSAPPPRAHIRTAEGVVARLRELGDPERALGSARFFKTGPGEYGEGDRFRGITVPAQRQVVGEVWRTLPLAEVPALLASEWHEDRLTALFILVKKFERAEEADRRAIYRLYLASAKRINNWDLVDCSAPGIVGAWLLEHPAERPVLARLARSRLLWERRIAMVSTYAFIRAGEGQVALDLAEQLFDDEHDLMHKAVGWMLREVGKRQSSQVLRDFLAKHAARLPRTALRYAIEHFSPAERKRWLAWGKAKA